MKCPKDPRDWHQTFQIYPVGINESVIVDLEMICQCDCERPGNFGYEDRSAAFPGAMTSNAGECVILIDPSRTGGAVDARLAGLFEQLAAAGVERLPGDLRYARRRRSLAEGIAVPDETYETVRRLASG